jgi:hypothetical protein
MSMKKTHSPEQVIDILRSIEKETNQGKTVAEACRALSISEWTFRLEFPFYAASGRVAETRAELPLAQAIRWDG